MLNFFCRYPTGDKPLSVDAGARLPSLSEMQPWDFEHVEKYSNIAFYQKSSVAKYVPRSKKSGTAGSVIDKKSGVSDYVPRGKKSGTSDYVPRGKKSGASDYVPRGKKSGASDYVPRGKKSGASDYVPRGKKSDTASSVGDNKSDVSDYV